jgi:tetratricopeptide (TPR) repeat protein
MPTAKLKQNQLFIAICLGLAAGTFILYWPITHDGFTNFDDDGYVTGNPHVKAGLTWAGILWAFQAGYAANWHPLTWISHMIDVQLFGMDPAGHHFMNLLFHTANTLLLFILLNNLTGAIWRSAFVAALFAWHPLHVESVAWASERKDVLSAFFWMFTLIAYGSYAKARSASRSGFATAQYLLSLFLFACGLMSKPMVVTLPFVLLLLDFWPLQRFNPSTLKQLLLEKIPFFALAFAGSVVTYLVQKTGGAVSGDPLSFRVLNALWAYERYIAKIFWPSGLAIVYPFPAHGLLLLGIIAAVLLAVCSLAFTFLSGQKPYFFTGWFWFLGTLVPAIGVVEVGSASMADRYSYLPSIGLFILVTWALADFIKSPHGKNLLAVTGTAALMICIILTHIQIGYWRNSITLFSHALQVTTDNYVADACLGQALDIAGDDKDALKYCGEAVRIDPDYSPGQFFLGTALWKTGDTKNAEIHLSAAARSATRDSGFQYNVGKFFMERGRLTEAATYFAFAITNNPDNSNLAEEHNALGKTYLKEGNVKDAASELSKAVALEPDTAQFHYDLGTLLFNASKTDQATAEYSKAIELQPDFAQAHENLAVALASQGKLDQAIAEFSTVVHLQTNNPDAYFNLGFAYLNYHQPAQAAAQFSQELRLTPNETKAHYRLAQALEQQNDFTNAFVQYREALRLTPNFTDAKNELDQILAAHPELRRLPN